MKSKLTVLLTGTLLSAATLVGVAAHAGSSNDTAEVGLFQKAQQDVGAAIRAAETATGGKAVSAEFSDKGGSGIWSVETVTGTKRVDLKIDAASGEVIETKDEVADAGNETAEVTDAGGAPLAELAAKAAAAGGGKVMSIDFENENGKAAGVGVEIVLSDGSVQDFHMDAASGKLTPGGGPSENGEDNTDGEDSNG
ncbi:MAG: PepSY domain-containing protein [Proteobacteria bacterium]|nr:PepSY domain-containing protein [Pseudomonadota bacterium]MBS0571656.1 PepSY domain-containing protein [Pseudomonadota bacterium]